MSPSEDPDAEPEPARDPGDEIHLEARASGTAEVYQAGRDQHRYYFDGVRELRRTTPGPATQDCPYPGLAAFGPEQAGWFFGRDTLIAELVTRLDHRRHTGGMQVVIAPSGAGKSSLLRAGLLPKLDHAALPGSDRWPKVVLTPTVDPLWVLAANLARLTDTDVPELVERLTANPSLCLPMLADALRDRTDDDPRARVVVVVDQFEELFTLCVDDRQRRAFIEVLVELAGGRADSRLGVDPVGLVVVGVRADFYAACLDHPRLRAALQDAPLVVGPMSDEELRETILRPAWGTGLDVEPGLVELLLHDLGTTSGTGEDAAGAHEAGRLRLPLLAHALRVSWQQRNGSTLTVAGYLHTGRIQDAVANSAEEVYANLDDAGRLAAQWLFLRLTKIGDGTEDTRRRVRHAELVSGSTNPAEVAAVVDAFTEARLLVRQQDTVEITHEALIRGWPRLRGWIDTDRVGRLTHQNLEEAAAAWHQHDRDQSALYRGSQLDTADTWAATSAPGDLSPTAREFLTASTTARRRGTRRRTATIAALAALALVATATAVIAVQQQRDALRQRDLAVYSRILTEADELRGTDTSLSAQLDLVAHRIQPGDETYTRLITAGNTPLSTPLTGHTGSVWSVAFSPDRRTLASVGADHTVRLWNTATPGEAASLGQPLIGSFGIVWTVAFSPDGHTLATGSNDNTVRLWNVTDPARPSALGQPLSGHTDAIYSVAFSPDGHTLASASADHTVLLWNVSDPNQPTSLGQPLTGHTDSVYSVAFSQDGHTLASGSADHTVRLWNVADPTQPTPLGQPLTGHTGTVFSVAFSPDRRTLASTGADYTTRLWNITDPSQPTSFGAPLTGHFNTVTALAFSQDGHILATASDDQTVRLTDTSNPRQPTPLGQPLTAHTNAVTALAFSQDGRTFATGSRDSTVRLWSLPASPLTGHTNYVYSVAFSPDGHTLATGSRDSTARLWDTTNPARPTPLGTLTGHTNTVLSVAFSPDGHTLATGSYDKSIRLWNLADPGRPTPLGQPLLGHTDAVWSVAFSPDGHTLASGSADKSVRLWNISDPTRATPLGEPLVGHTNVVRSVAFSPDGHTLATGSEDKSIRLWNLTDPAKALPLGEPLTDHTDYVYGVAFSPDGHTLASASADSTIRLWNTNNPNKTTPLGQPLKGHTNYVYAVAFSPDGHTLASASADSTIRLWNTNNPNKTTPLGQPLKGHTNYVYAVAFSPNGHALATGSSDLSVRLWGLDVDQDVAWICAATRNTLTAEQWQRYVGGDLPYQPPCG
ncbi:hypothetical protein F0L68_31100 [Solihabitans fulvus]|uniref:Novel STAND NTPase 1 domain-containing protein n=1 Tax=Solihabitans fulvus TaxID=1892852 RepID=A0A5B2WTA7_9PSEU|nr:WD40 repeat domain-containing protein [Solihabitans fulvus]KAA2254060.1 hypothetical protein F0L68_31100 [Solihabitans fulvus]